jgi:Putative DNA-binding domain
MKPQEAFAFNLRQVQELKKLVSRGEGLTLEFKRKATYPEKVVREMIALANTKGGIVLIGIGDDGTVPGLKHPEGEAHVIKEALRKCKPPLSVKETFIPNAPSRTVIQYEVAESSNKPHYIINDENIKESYVRVADKSIKASREMREIAKRSQRKKDIRFHYGEPEKLLMQYLDSTPSITLKKFCEVSGLKKFYASRKLVLLVLADVLRITPHEKGDLYSLAFKTSPKKPIGSNGM